MSYTEGYERSTRLALGQIRGVFSVQIRGYRFSLPGFSEAYVWDGPDESYIFTDPITGRINRASSDSTLDVGKEVLVVGLDENWFSSTQIVTLNGQNKVILNPELIRINQLIAQTDLDGDLYVYEDTAITNGVPNDTTKVKGYISVGNNISQSAIFTIPVGFSAIFKTAAYGLVPSAQCCSTFINASRTYGGAEIRYSRFPLVQNGTTLTLQTPETSFLLPEKTDIYILVRTSSVGASINAIADWELIRNPEQLSQGQI